MTRPLLAWLFILLLPLASTEAVAKEACSYLDGDTDASRSWNDIRQQARANTLDDVAKADRFVRAVFGNTRAPLYDVAATTYMRLFLSPEPATRSDAHASIVQCHREQLQLILPAALSRTMDRTMDDAPQSESALRDVRTWLRSQDPLPSTPVNERVVEHLQRVAVAMDRFKDLDTNAGVDARGVVYIRLGEPHRTTSVQFNNSRVIQIIRESPILTRSDFPPNQYWVYPSLGKYAGYIFVKDGKTWSIGEALDLIPSFYRSGMGNNRRGRERSQNLGILLEEVYSQLSTINIDYAPLYHEAESATALTLSGSGSTMSRMRRLVGRGRHYDRDLAFRRQREVPNQRPSQPRADVSFPVSLRTARFLTPSGDTRTEVYWGLSPNVLAQAPASTIRFTAVQYGSAYERDTVQVKQYRVSARDSTDASAIIAPTLHCADLSKEDTYHLGFQWDWFRLAQDAPTQQAAPHTTVQRADTLQSLSSNEGQLEMSDLRVTFAPTGLTDEQIDAVRPYPFTFLGAQDSFALYFEVYHLGYGSNDQTEYTVEYAFRKWSDDEWVPFDDEQQQVTTTETTYSGQSRRTEEFIVLDASEWSDVTDVDRIQVVVRVTDENTGQDVSRNVAFDYVSAMP